MAGDGLAGERHSLSELIFRRLADGSLPPFRAQRTFGGRGDGACCGCCDRLIGPADIQYDVDEPHVAAGAAATGAAGAAQTIPMHLTCYRLWVEMSALPPSTP
jgi:hypothetical protein